LPAALVAATSLLAISTAMGYYLYYPCLIGKAQPIPFSHRFHVTEKRLSCFMCHPGAISTARAGVPPLETCMLCHRHIIVTYPEIEELRRHYDRRVTVEWEKVNDVPEFVYFDHSVHIRRGFDCSTCHGDVAGMDRVTAPYDLVMGFCVRCHRDQQFSHDCFICHR
jgi:hypothetical protein